MSKQPKEQFCAYCGESLGFYVQYSSRGRDTCGKPECDRWARDEAQAEREEAHRRLDEDLGYGEW